VKPRIKEFPEKPLTDQLSSSSRPLPVLFHMSDYETVDGISIPIEISRLNDPNLTDSLREYTPKQLIREMSQFSEILSSRE
jgi:hypothetical protein